MSERHHSKTAFGRQLSLDPQLAARVRRTVLREAWRNERRINAVRVGLLAVGIGMMIAFHLQTGPSTRETTLWQISVGLVWMALGVGIGALHRRERMPRWLPYFALSVDMSMLTLLAAVRMLTVPPPWDVAGGCLSERLFLMVFPVLASAGLRFDTKVMRSAEIMALCSTLALVAVDQWVIGVEFKLYFVAISLLAVVGTGQLTALVTARGRKLIEDTVRVEREREFVRSTFARYVSSDVARTLLEQDLAALRKGSLREVVILFSDIRGFTGMSAEMKPEDVVSFLNEYFESMVGAVFDHGGTIDKFMGDGIMAVFGAPVEIDRQVEQACRTALAMRRALADLNAKRALSGGAPIRIGIGLHVGYCVVGAIGAEQRLDFTAVGSPVNFASRVEGLSKRLGADILVSAAVAQQLPPSFVLRSMGAHQVRGAADPIEVFELAEGPA